MSCLFSAPTANLFRHRCYAAQLIFVAGTRARIGKPGKLFSQALGDPHCGPCFRMSYCFVFRTLVTISMPRFRLPLVSFLVAWSLGLGVGLGSKCFFLGRGHGIPASTAIIKKHLSHHGQHASRPAMRPLTCLSLFITPQLPNAHPRQPKSFSGASKNLSTADLD